MRNYQFDPGEATLPAEPREVIDYLIAELRLARDFIDGRRPYATAEKVTEQIDAAIEAATTGGSDGE